MNIHYYLTLYPMEAMIASQLSPEAFAAYMAIGSRKGSAERLMFFEVDEKKITGAFDIDYARKHCVAHPDGNLKNSVYLSVYRVLERTAQNALGLFWLVTKDGRSLSINPVEYIDPDPWLGTALYQELCPSSPLVVSALKPRHFAEYIVDDTNKLTMPTIFFADLTMPKWNNDNYTGNVGGYFDKISEHLKYCANSLEDGKGKISKVVDRSAFTSFNYQVVGCGFYVGSQGGKLSYYPMPSREELKKNHYDWGKSALIF